MAKLKYELELVVVRGVGTFPFDMLRYDHCVPAREKDSIEMGRPHYESERTIVLKRYIDQPGKWTPERWKSFGWTLCGDRAGRPWKTLGETWRDVEMDVNSTSMGTLGK